MTTPNSTAVRGKQSDPRIVSPEIKVVYPSENMEKDLETPTVPPVAQVLSPAVFPTMESTAITEQHTSAPQAAESESKKSPTWKDTIQEHSRLFIAVALISAGIGYLIGKKM